MPGMGCRLVSGIGRVAARAGSEARGTDGALKFRPEDPELQRFSRARGPAEGCLRAGRRIHHGWTTDATTRPLGGRLSGSAFLIARTEVSNGTRNSCAPPAIARRRIGRTARMFRKGNLPVTGQLARCQGLCVLGGAASAYRGGVERAARTKLALAMGRSSRFYRCNCAAGRGLAVAVDLSRGRGSIGCLYGGKRREWTEVHGLFRLSGAPVLH